MVTLVVEDVPEVTRLELFRRAAQRGQTLEQYLRVELTRLAATPTMEEVLRRIETHHGGRVGSRQAVADIEAERSLR